MLRDKLLYPGTLCITQLFNCHKPTVAFLFLAHVFADIQEMIVLHYCLCN